MILHASFFFLSKDCFDLLLSINNFILDVKLLSVCNFVSVKVYPGQRAGGIEADMMAANELNAHSFLQV